MRALVIGGTGPTGHFVVNGLRARGYRVTILHTGNHEVEEIPDDVEHVHTNPFEVDQVDAALEGRRFDVCVAMYGRLRRLAEYFSGRTGQFLSVGGVPAYRGYMNPELLEPAGMPVPIPEDVELVRDPGHDEKGYRIVRTEEAVFQSQPRATHFRYPQVYGAYQPLPREWCVVRRILDGRRRIIVPEDGLTLQHMGYAENLAHALLLAVERPEAAAGQVYNCADEEVPTLRQTIERIASALGAQLEIVSMPWSLAVPARPLIAQRLTTHRVLDLTKLKSQLGYRDRVPAGEALARTARWLRDHPPAPGGPEEMSLQDVFDYAAEDRLIQAWETALRSVPEIAFEPEPGLTLGYSGPGGRPRGQQRFEP